MSITYKNIKWKYYHGALIPDVAPHVKINLSKEDRRHLLKQSKAYFLRYVTNWDTRQNTDFWYVIKDKKESIEQYNKKRRYEIKKGLKNCIVKKVDNIEIATNGFNVYKKALKSYSVELATISKEDFYKSTLKKTKCEYFAVFERLESEVEMNKRGAMIAYSQNNMEDESVNYTTIKFHPDFMGLYPSYALLYTMNEYYLNKKKNIYVNDGARSISHDTNIQNFLIQKFNFRKAYCKLNVFYRWDVKIIVNILFLFRKIFSIIDNKAFNKISVLMKQEEIRRSCE
jgi:hypothetical protein